MMRTLRWVTANWILLAAGLIVAGLIVLVVVPGPKGAADAVAICKQLVKDRLKAPTTAQFAGDRASGSSPRWTVTGTVTSENSFGAALASDYACTVRLEGGAFVLESLTGLR